MGATEKTVVKALDGRACSGSLGRTGTTVEKTQMGLRSRWRRFESCKQDVAPELRVRRGPGGASDRILDKQRSACSAWRMPKDSPKVQATGSGPRPNEQQMVT